MQLVTQELRQQLPPLYATEEQEDPIVVCKFFTPWSIWTWYAMEFDGEDTFFGWVDGFELEHGYFTLSELESASGPFGLKVERDLSFKPCRWSAIEGEVRTRRCAA